MKTCTFSREWSPAWLSASCWTTPFVPRPRSVDPGGQNPPPPDLRPDDAVDEVCSAAIIAVSYPGGVWLINHTPPIIRQISIVQNCTLHVNLDICCQFHNSPQKFHLDKPGILV